MAKKVEETKIQRVYGKTFSIGDVIRNSKTGITFCKIQAGFFGFHTINLIENKEGTYDLEKQYFKDGEYKTVKIGKTFKATDKDGKEVEGITNATLGLDTNWSKELEKDITTTGNALFISTHLLKEEVKINDDLAKIGWIDGRFGIEIDSE